MAKKSVKNGSFSHEDFVKAYRDSTSVDEVAEKLGVDRSFVQTKSYHLRKIGVNLPRYAGSRQKIDVNALNKILEA
jgi:hypothetical protein